MTTNTSSQSSISADDMVAIIQRLAEEMSPSPFVRLMKREGCLGDGKSIMLIPKAWLETELGQFLEPPHLRPWMRLSLLIDCVHIFNPSLCHSPDELLR